VNKRSRRTSPGPEGPPPRPSPRDWDWEAETERARSSSLLRSETDASLWGERVSVWWDGRGREGVRTRWSVASPSKECRKSFDPKVPVDLMMSHLRYAWVL
jgi:hypothetical protein